MTVTRTEAIACIDKGILKAKTLDVQISLAVVDAFGQLVQLDRMDGASLMSPDVAEAKAVTAVNFKEPTSQVADIDPTVLGSLKEIAHFDVVALAGGVPIVRNGELVGAIGVSGASPDQDEAVADHAVSPQG